MTTVKDYEIDVAISYAGEDRTQARALAEALERRNVKCFYDEYARAELWGDNLYTRLSDIYQNKARYCVIFCSAHYAAKLWTKHELQAAQARALRETKPYILPIQLDETEIPGILSTVARLSWPPENAETIADAVMEKLGRTAFVPPRQVAVSPDVVSTPSQPNALTIAPGKPGRVKENKDDAVLQDTIPNLV